VKAAPSRIDPVFMPRIWGSRSLAPLFPDKIELAEPIGEAWLTSVDCRIVSGPYQGQTLGAAWHEMPIGWRGSSLANTPEFPILVKFIFPADKLSIQVHPDGAYAYANERAAGGRGKTEMWHACAAEPGAQVLIGLKPGVTREQFHTAIETYKVEELFETHRVRKGDTFFIAPGTPHAIGSGMVLCEVQEYSDLTYRVYDYGRTDSHGNPRELHIEKALAVTDFDKTLRAGRVLGAPPSGEHSNLLAACYFFSTERQEFNRRVKLESNPYRFELLIVVSGSGTIEWQDQKSLYIPGECWFMPATLGRYTLSPNTETVILHATVPNMALLRTRLKDCGVPTEEIEKALF
jgi:mannose-6-phosphate isomerase